MDVDIPTPNPVLTERLRSARMREIVFEIASNAQFLYQTRVAKRSGRLALTAHASTEIGGAKHDRWIGVMAVSSRAVEYEAAHEFGYIHKAKKGKGRRVRASKGSPLGRFIPGAHDLNAVLEELASL